MGNAISNSVGVQKIYLSTQWRILASRLYNLEELWPQFTETVIDEVDIKIEVVRKFKIL